ncbi:MAG: carbohydrate ABC transporter permease [Acholeplasmataceae bacterium]|nr:carbohydrate ABC transporter permease [Acholeplasmataceae bacterium]MDD4204165.1 carbohydrate ABC transporter permease [Acholeplasmataceae bacterium]MDD4469053.1 carbohydrate ABC transporter permease [Acholeplasmataceae bacterium]MDD4824372.1 carbohydrate ABC transporter permease [Acholeplasmataceae bacterium]
MNKSAVLKKMSLVDKLPLYFLRFFIYLILIIFSGIIIFLFYTLFVNASRPHIDISKGFSILPGNFFGRNFMKIITQENLFVLEGIRNSLFIGLVSATLTTYFSALTAYAIHLYQFKGRRFIHLAILAVMMIPSQIAGIGLVTILYSIGFVNNYWVIIIPAIASPATFFYMKQYIQSVLPYEIIEAARVDGSSEFRTFNQLVLPIIRPALSVQFIFAFVASWNNLFIPSLIIQDGKKRTLPIIIAQLGVSDPKNFDQGARFMLMFLAIIPTVIIYLIFSKYIIKGTTAGSVKG